MLNGEQIRLVQVAVRAAGLRSPGEDGRYRLLLAQYKQPGGSPVTSCKQLDNKQLDDLLSICEAHGWKMPGKPDNFYRIKAAKESDFASYAQQEAIRHLAGDLGWDDFELGGMLARMTNDKVCSVVYLTPNEAYKIIEALKAMLGRKTGKQYSNLKQVKEDIAPATGTGKVTDGENKIE